MRLNTYSATFFARCPTNQARVMYRLEVVSSHFIPAERINDAVERVNSGFHEEIADRLFDELGGSQTLTAHHHGVDIKTERA